MHSNSVQGFYAGKTIFITGASGFMGKVLIERLMYNCPELEEIFILIRDRGGKSAKQRVKDFEALPLFQLVMAEKPGIFSKVTPVVGDLLKPNFGLDDVTLRKVETTTEIFFHLAASSRLDAALRYNVLHNLVATKNVLTLAKHMKRLVHFMHLSSAYCNVEPKRILEKVYELKSSHDPEDLIRMTEWMTDSTMDAISKDLLGPHLNSFTYTKRLAEILVQRENGSLPMSIVRPAVLLPTIAQPMPGWDDSLNGVGGLFFAISKGILRSLYLDSKATFQFIPVDTAVNAIITIPKVLSENEFSTGTAVYHLTSHGKRNCTLGEIFGFAKRMTDKYPVTWPLWYPDCRMTTNWYLHSLEVFLFQLIPAYLTDFVLIVFKQKPYLVNAQRRIKAASEALASCVERPWHFSFVNAESLQSYQSTEEKKMFPMNYEENLDESKYIENIMIAARQFYARDSLSALPLARWVYNTQYLLHQFCKFLLLYFITSLLLQILGLERILKSIISKNISSYSR